MGKMEEDIANAQAMIGSADADRMKMVSEAMRNAMHAYLDEQDVSPPKKRG